jgi:predicted RNA binding protein YcfA (HicA-like mRNA interferase family)
VSDKLPAIKPQRLIRVLEAKGWQHRRTRGSHHYMIHPERRDAIAVPVHNRDVKPGLLLGILKTAGISRDELAGMVGQASGTESSAGP